MKETQQEINERLVEAALRNDLPLIKDLLSSPNLSLHAQINGDTRFIGNICFNGDLNTLRYVLTSPELKEHADIHWGCERGLICAVHKGDVPMVKYLLTSPEIKDHANLHFQDESGKHTVIEYVFTARTFEQSEKLVEYFTSEYAVEKKDIQVYKNLLKYSDDSDFEHQIANNIMINLTNEKDEGHQKELLDLLQEIDPQKYEKVMLKGSLKDSLPTSENTVTTKMKV